MTQSQQNFMDDLFSMGDHYVRQFLHTDADEQDLIDEFYEYIEFGGETNFR